MFDIVNHKCKCPTCNNEVTGFQSASQLPIGNTEPPAQKLALQSKDGEGLLSTLQVIEVDNFYSECPNCRTWIEFDRVSWGLFEMKYGPLLDIDKYSKLVYIRKC